MNGSSWKDLHLQIHSLTIKRYTKLKIYKYITSVPNFFSFPRNVSSIPRPIRYQELSKKRNWKNLRQRNVLVFMLFFVWQLMLSTSFTLFSAFLRMLSYLLQLKLLYKFYFLLLSVTIFANLNIFLDIIPFLVVYY